MKIHMNYAAVIAAAALPEGKILNLDKSLVYNIFIQLFNVAVLIVILTFLLYKPVRKFLADRRQRISDEIDGARKIRDEAVQLREKYEKMIAGIEAEREEILRLTHKKAVEKSDQLLFEARREAEVLTHRAKAELDVERENMADEIKSQIIEIAHHMAGHFVQLSMDRMTQDRLIEQAFAEWDAGEEASVELDDGGSQSLAGAAGGDEPGSAGGGAAGAKVGGAAARTRKVDARWADGRDEHD